MMATDRNTIVFAISIDSRKFQFTVLQSSSARERKITDGSANVPTNVYYSPADDDGEALDQRRVEIVHRDRRRTVVAGVVLRCRTNEPAGTKSAIVKGCCRHRVEQCGQPDDGGDGRRWVV
uniref:Uncharacterized protein n=1 Tax=Anopheles coluzzii TaxID=1518534 RepID=A0A8W7PGN4_ANOCL